MIAFLVKLALAVGLFFTARYLKGRLVQILGKPNADEESRRGYNSREQVIKNPRLWRYLTNSAYTCSALLFLWSFAGTSYIMVSSSHIATLKREYFGTSLAPGQIVGQRGQLGPQARVITAGFHPEFLITLLYTVTEEPVFTVPNGQCAIISARDGVPPKRGAAFAEPWSDEEKHKLINDAEYFLSNNRGQRGPQTTVLTPDSYTINPFLWEKPKLISAIRVEQGTEGVVKSSVLAMVDFGSFRRPLPTNNILTVLTGDKLPKGSAEVQIVPVGAIGVWEEPLPNGLYYVNTEAYKITIIPNSAVAFEYKGGYMKRTVDISTDAEGKIIEKKDQNEVQPVPNSADTAIFTKPEGWDVAQELRVLVQVRPGLGPFVAASLRLTEENATQIIEDRVVTPIIRSVTREVEGGAHIEFSSMKAELDSNNMPVLGTNGEPKIKLVKEFRAVRVLDLLENRNSVEEAIEHRSRIEAEKEGIQILEVRLAETSIPPELLIARKREQLAQQLTAAWKEEENAQTQRRRTENERATSQQQPILVAAQIAEQAAEKTAKARTIEGEGEKSFMLSVAEGQKAQAEVLGQQATVNLQVQQQIIKAIENIINKNPDILAKALENAHKFVPSVMVNGSGGGGSLEGAAAIFGHLMNKDPMPQVKTVSTNR